MKIKFRLYLISDGRSDAERLEKIFRRAARAGVKGFQIRENGMSDPAVSTIATLLGFYFKRRWKFIFINSRVNSAEVAGVHVHLPEPDIPNIPAIREIRGESVLIGASTHSLESARAAESAGADFVVFGPVFETESKKEFGPPQGVGTLKTVCAGVHIPVFAVGGITPENTKECIAAGAHGVACISAVMNADDIEGVVKRFAAVMPNHSL